MDGFVSFLLSALVEEIILHSFPSFFCHYLVDIYFIADKVIECGFGVQIPLHIHAHIHSESHFQGSVPDSGVDSGSDQALFECEK